LKSNATQITYTPRPDATPEAELAVLAQIYMSVLERKKAAEPTQPDGRDDAKESNGCIATEKYNRRSA
jgi:hypothetical protein